MLHQNGKQIPKKRYGMTEVTPSLNILDLDTPIEMIIS